MLFNVLRPSNSLLGSSKAARRANVRAERVKAIGHAARGLRGLVSWVFGAVAELALLLGLPFLYLAGAYFTLDLPARWITHRDSWGLWGLLVFLASLTICLVGVARAAQGSPPVAPVRPQFAKTMLRLSWITALLLTIGDLVS